MAYQDPLNRWQIALAQLWQKQSSWSRRADELKKTKISWTGPLTILTLGGAILGTVSPQIAPWIAAQKMEPLRILAGIVPALLVSISAYLTKELLGPKRDEEWILARTIAEQLKAEGYIYATGAPPYSNVDESPLQLHRRGTELEKKGEKLLPVPAPAGDVSSRHPHDPVDITQYLSSRIDKQIDFHLNGARAYKRSLDKWRIVGMALGLVSLVIGGVGTALHQEAFNVWLGMVTTGVATLNSFVLGQRYEYLVGSYSATARTLDDLKKSWALDPNQSAAKDRFVLDCEATLAAQNRSWADYYTKAVDEALRQKPKQQ